VKPFEYFGCSRRHWPRTPPRPAFRARSPVSYRTFSVLASVPFLIPAVRAFIPPSCLSINLVNERPAAVARLFRPARPQSGWRSFSTKVRRCRRMAMTIWFDRGKPGLGTRPGPVRRL